MEVAKMWIKNNMDPPGFKVENFPVKGRGIVTTIKRISGEFLLHYTGEIITATEGEKREDLSSSGFRYFFRSGMKQLCADATEETGRLGRLVNHARKGKNSAMKELNGQLALFCIRDIEAGEEVTYDYGLKKLPWEKCSQDEISHSAATLQTTVTYVRNKKCQPAESCSYKDCVDHRPMSEKVTHSKNSSQSTAKSTIVVDTDMVQEPFISSDNASRCAQQASSHDTDTNAEELMITDDNEDRVEKPLTLNDKESVAEKLMITDDNEDRVEKPLTLNDKESVAEKLMITDDNEDRVEKPLTLNDKESVAEKLMITDDNEDRVEKPLTLNDEDSEAEKPMISDDNEDGVERPLTLNDEDSEAEKQMISDDNEDGVERPLTLNDKESVAEKPMITDDNEDGVERHLTSSDKESVAEKLMITDDNEDRVERPLTLNDKESVAEKPMISDDNEDGVERPLALNDEDSEAEKPMISDNNEDGVERPLTLNDEDSEAEKQMISDDNEDGVERPLTLNDEDSEAEKPMITDDNKDGVERPLTLNDKESVAEKLMITDDNEDRVERPLTLNDKESVAKKPTLTDDNEDRVERPLTLNDKENVAKKPTLTDDNEDRVERPLAFNDKESVADKPMITNDNDIWEEKPLAFNDKEIVAEKPTVTNDNEIRVEKPLTLNDEESVAEKPTINDDNKSWVVRLLTLNDTESVAEKLMITGDNEDRVEKPLTLNDKESVAKKLMITDDNEDRTEIPLVLNDKVSVAEKLMITDDNEDWVEKPLTLNDKESVAEKPTITDDNKFWVEKPLTLNMLNDKESVAEKLTITNYNEIWVEKPLTSNDKESLAEKMTITDDNEDWVEKPFALNNKESVPETPVISDDKEIWIEIPLTLNDKESVAEKSVMPDDDRIVALAPVFSAEKASCLNNLTSRFSSTSNESSLITEPLADLDQTSESEQVWGSLTRLDQNEMIVMCSKVLAIGRARSNDIIVETATEHEVLIEVNRFGQVFLVDVQTSKGKELIERERFEVGGQIFQWKYPLEKSILRESCLQSDIVPGSDSDESNVVPEVDISVQYVQPDSTTEDGCKDDVIDQIQIVSKERNGKHDYSKKHCCVFCGKLDLKISRHLETKHSNERIIATLPPKAAKNQSAENQKEREKILDRLRNQGDFMFNVDVLKNLKHGKSAMQLIVARRPETGIHSASDYLPCKFCLKFYVKAELWRHCKNCKYAESTLDISTKSNSVKEHMSFISSGRCLLQGAGVTLGQDDTLDNREEFHHYIIASMADDGIGLAAKRDSGIVSYGKSRFEKLGKQRAAGVRYNMRLLARIKIKLLLDDPVGEGPNLESYLRPENFYKLVRAVKQVVGISDERSLNGVIMFNNPEVAKKSGQALKKLGELYEGRMVMDRNEQGRNDASDFLLMYQKQWKDKIGSVAHQTSRERSFNKKEVLPATDDIMKLQKFQNEQITKKTKVLSAEMNKTNWNELALLVLSKVQTFNFRRGNETAKMQLSKYVARADWRLGNQEIYKSLGKIEMELAKRMDLVEVMGKLNKKVPVLLTPAMKTGIDLLNSTRNRCGVSAENPYVFAKGDEKYITGAEALNHVLKNIPDLKQPEHLRLPKLRKYLATVTQLFGLEDTELQEVARHMGHELAVHRRFYRLQDDVIELAKISKLLLAVEAGKAHHFSGFSLDDIDLDQLPGVCDEKVSTQIGSEEVSDDEDRSAIHEPGCLVPPAPHEEEIVGTAHAIEGHAGNRIRLSDAEDMAAIHEPGCLVRPAPHEEERVGTAHAIEGHAGNQIRSRPKRSLTRKPDVFGFDFDKDIVDTGMTNQDELTSESDSDEVPIKKAKVPKRKWSDVEMECLKLLIKRSYVEGKPPVKEQVLKAKKENPPLRNIPWLKIKHQVVDLYQELLWNIDLERFPSDYEPPSIYFMLLYELDFHLGVAYQHLGNHAEAAAQFSKAIEDVSVAKNGCLAGCLTNSCLMTPIFARRAFANAKLGSYKLSLKDAEKAVVLDSGSPDVYCVRALVRSSFDEEVMGLRDLDIAVKIDPNHICSTMLKASFTKPLAVRLCQEAETYLTCNSFLHPCVLEFYDKFLFPLSVPHTITRIDLTPEKPTKKQLESNGADSSKPETCSRPASSDSGSSRQSRAPSEIFRCGTTSVMSNNRISLKRRTDYGNAIRNHISRPKSAQEFFDQLEKQKRYEKIRKRAQSALVRPGERFARFQSTPIGDTQIDGKSTEHKHARPVTAPAGGRVSALSTIRGFSPEKIPQTPVTFSPIHQYSPMQENMTSRNDDVDGVVKDRPPRPTNRKKILIDAPKDYAIPVFQSINIKGAPRMYYRPWGGDKLPVAERSPFKYSPAFY